MHPYVQLMQTWFDEVWTNGNDAIIDQLLVPRSENTGLGKDPIMGPEDFRQFHRGMMQRVTQVELEIRHALVDENRVMMACTISAVDGVRDVPVFMTGSMTYLVHTREDGQLQIANCENTWDFISFFAQLGLLPTDTFAKLLGGAALDDKSS